MAESKWWPVRWYMRALMVLAVVVVIFVVLYVWPDSRIVVSPETTYLTEPLDADGYVDYLAAINQRASEGVTPENNAAVLYWQALGPRPIDAEHRVRFFLRLGIDPLPAEGEYYQSLYSIQGPLDEKEKDAIDRGDDEAYDAMEARHERREQRRDAMGYTPWVPDDDALMAQWLNDNRKPIDLFVEGTFRPKHFVPKLFAPEKWDDETAAVLESSSYGRNFTYREMGRTLMQRSMLHSGSARHHEAWQDCLACFRLARHVATEPHTAGALNGFAQIASTAAGVATILHEGRFNAGELTKMRHEFRDVSTCPSLSEAVNWGDRLLALDIVHTLSRVPRGLRGGIDWNQVLRDFNHFYDLAVAEMKRENGESDGMSLDEEFESFENENAWLPAVHPFSRWVRSRQITILTAQLLLPASYVFKAVERRCEARLERIEVVFALSLYRAEHGEYPESLAALMPDFLDEVPRDPFDGKPVRYRRHANGYSLWIVGRNGVDDDGRTAEDWEDDEEMEGRDGWDDDVFRVPQRLKPMTETVDEETATAPK